jgi:hypothetical protein
VKEESAIDRRKFLHRSGLATSALVLAGAPTWSPSAMASERPADHGTHPAFSPYSFDDVAERFAFAVIGDPHIIPRDGKGPQWYNEFYRTALDEIGAMKPTPAFVVVVGDVVSRPEDGNYAVLLEISKQSTVPVLWVHGNHDGTAKNPPIFAKYQKLLNGYERYYGSFNAGKWHFLWIPDECQLWNEALAAEVFAWMEKDLQENRQRPTTLFLHRHLLSVGLTQMEYYAFSMENRDKILELAFKYGNVKQVFSGHVHNGIKASIRSAWSYQGANFILSPTVHRPRDWGKFEEFPEYMPRYMGKNETGGFYMLVDVDGGQVTALRGRCAGVAGEHAYPTQFKPFSPQLDPRWAKPLGQLAPHQELVNGDFEEGLNGWSMPYRYQAEKLPLCEWKAADNPAAEGKKSAYLLCRSARYLSGADDVALDLYQEVAVRAGVRPALKACYYPEQTSPFGGGYIRLAGYARTEPKLGMMFHWGQQEEQATVLIQTLAYAELGREGGRGDFEKGTFFWDLADAPGKWHELQVDIAGLYEKVLQGKRRFEDLAVDKILVACGVWCGHTTENQLEVDEHFVWHPKGTPFDQGAYFDHFHLDLAQTSTGALKSTNDGRPLGTNLAQLKSKFGHARQPNKK